MINFIIDGKCVGKQRPRFQRVGNFVKTYTPKETLDYESRVVFAYKNSGCEFMGQVSIKARISVHISLNKGDYGKKGLNKSGREKLSGVKRPTVKPDCDNIAKSILDALNGVAYNDDSQVVELVVEKHYDEKDYVEVSLTNADKIGKDKLAIAEVMKWLI